MRRPGLPVLAPVLLLAGAGIGVLVAEPAEPPAPAPVPAAADPVRQVGTRELVRITGPTGDTVEAVARIDTGASASSIDDDIAEDLGFDLAGADTVTVASSLGREERPVVIGALQLGGQAAAARFSVTDRSQRSAPVLLGRDDLRGVHVVVGTDEDDDAGEGDQVRPYEEDAATRDRLVALIEEAQQQADDEDDEADDPDGAGPDEDQDEDDDDQ